MALTATRTAQPFWPRNTLSSTITAAGDALTTNTYQAQSITVIRVTCSGGALDLTSVPILHPGFQGQPMEIINVGSNVLTLEDEALNTGSGLKLSGYPRVSLAQNQSIQLSYVTDGALNKWVLLSEVNDLITGTQNCFAGGGQASATPLFWPSNRLTTVGSNGDSVKLWAALGLGTHVRVFNATATNYADLFPIAGDAIDGMAVNQQISITPNTGVTLLDTAVGMWRTC